jgi:uncharacterized membrane protein YfcA
VSVVKRFGLPAVLSAIAGAAVLFWLQKAPPLYAYSLQGRELTVTPLKIVLAVLMAFFVFLESVPAFQKSGLPPKFLPVGGVLSGFFGGLSGHQGALRSLFLLKCGLSKERFLATGVVIACLVDLSRLAVYQRHLRQLPYETYLLPMMVSVACAFAGVFLANRLLQKITMKTIQRIVSALVLLIALLLAAGIV